MPALTVFNASEALKVPPESRQNAAPVRALRLVSLALLTALAALPMALAADSATRRFMVTGRASLSERWTYTATTSTGGCSSRVSATGLRTIGLRTSDLGAVRGTWAGGTARARFTGSILFGGTVTQSGTKTTRVTGAAVCDKGTHTSTCPRVRRTFSSRPVGLVSGHPHRIGFRPLRGIVAPAFYTDCPGEPTAIRRLSNGLEAADAGYRERELFDPSTGGYGVEGDTTLTTPVTNGIVVQRIRWSLLFRRVG